MRQHSYYVYILTNLMKTVVYVGLTNSLERRVQEHKADALGARKTYTGRYNCYYVVYMEHFKYINNAIAREKEIKSWTREKKNKLISEFNPGWKFLNESW
ncbi:MAG: GIY-YIG nuclease family protein [Bacteroidota bacterium]